MINQGRFGASKNVLYILVSQGLSKLPAVKVFAAPTILNLGEAITLMTDSFDAHMWDLETEGCTAQF